MKRVLLIGPSLSCEGGVSTQIELLLRSPLNRRYKLLHFQVGSLGGEKWAHKIWRLMISPIELVYWLLRYSPHIVHINPSFDTKSFLRDAVLLIVSKCFGRKVVIQFHGGKPRDLVGKWRTVNWLMPRVLNLADKVVVLSEAQRKPLAGVLPHSRLIKISNMVDASMFVPKKPAEFNVAGGRKNDRVRVIFLSKLRKTKGVYEVLEAIPLVASKHPNVVFYFAGSGEERPKLMKKCKEKGLEGHMVFLGYLRGREKVDALMNSDIFVLPSYSEGFPCALLEAMAAGLPVISCPEGAIAEVIQDGVNGFLVMPKRSDCLAEKIGILIEDASLRQSMGRANRGKASGKYDIRAGAHRVAKIYEELIEAAT